jgi:hypothetical protein
MKGSGLVGILLLVAVVLIVLFSSPTWHVSSARDTTHGASIVITTSTLAPAPTPAPRPVPRPSPEAWDVAQAAAGHVAIIGWLAALAVLPLFPLIAIALYGRHRSRLLEPDRPPLRDREAVHSIYDVRSLEARRGWLPESFTFAPRYTSRELAVEEAPAAALTSPGTVDDLLNNGRGLAYGWRVDNGEMLVDRQIRSLLVGGVQGSGKSSFVTLLVAQLVRMNARVMLADPDAMNREGLASRLTGLGIEPEQTAHEPAALFRLVVDAQHELMTRKGQGALADTRPYVVVVDELPECLRVLSSRDSAQLQSALELIGGLSGRKHAVSVIMLGQSWSKAVVGSTAMRNLITSSTVFRMRSDEAFYMTNLKSHYWRAAGPDPLELEPGMFYAVGIDSGAVLARVPALPPSRTRAREVSEVSSELGRGVPEVSVPAVADSSRTPAGQSNGHPPDSSRDPYLERVLELFRAGRAINAITREVHRIEPGGRAWQEARERVEAAIRRGLL